MALQEVTMPAMGADMTEGTVVKWLKSEGDSVAKGDKLAEIETDKTVVEMESYFEGVLRKIVLGDGTKAPVGTLIAYVGDPSDEVPEVPAAAGNGSTVATAATTGATTGSENASEKLDAPSGQAGGDAVAGSDASVPEPVVTPVAASGHPAEATDDEASERIKASPLARRLAREAGYELSQIEGTGPGGRITRDDVLGYTPAPVYEVAPAAGAMDAAPAPVQIDGSDIELSSMRQAIARVTSRSKSEAPHYYVTTAIDMTDAMAFRAQLNAEIHASDDRVSVNDMIIKALAMSLVEHPKWNAFYGDGKLVGHTDVNIGVAIALEAGLIVPALIGVQNMSLVGISRAARDLGRRARGDGGTLTQDELSAGTFSTSNLGMLDIDVFSAIIVPPQAGILAVGAAKPAPVVRDGEIVVRTIMHATISADHRVGDGAEAAVLMNAVKANLEHPLRLIL